MICLKCDTPLFLSSYLRILHDDILHYSRLVIEYSFSILMDLVNVLDVVVLDWL